MKTSESFRMRPTVLFGCLMLLMAIDAPAQVDTTKIGSYGGTSTATTAPKVEIITTPTWQAESGGTTPTAGTLITLKVFIKNNGTATADKLTYVFDVSRDTTLCKTSSVWTVNPCAADSAQIATAEVSSLAKGAGKELSTTWVAKRGYYTFGIYISKPATGDTATSSSRTRSTTMVQVKPSLSTRTLFYSLAKAAGATYTATKVSGSDCALIVNTQEYMNALAIKHSAWLDMHCTSASTWKRKFYAQGWSLKNGWYVESVGSPVYNEAQSGVSVLKAPSKLSINPEYEAQYSAAGYNQPQKILATVDIKITGPTDTDAYK